MSRVAAVDIGATSGRVFVFSSDERPLIGTEVHRFPNHPVEIDGRWTWDIDALWQHVVQGLAKACATGPIDSWGVDTWAVDYGLVAADGALVGPVYAYRDPQHSQGISIADSRLSWEEQYAIAGIQRLPFNTVNQLLAETDTSRFLHAFVLLVPDLLMFRATGTLATELTNASSTGLVDARTREFSAPLMHALGLEGVRFPPLVRTGSVRGETKVAGLPAMPVISVATHDTASAFIAVPMQDTNHAAVLSLGTWALIGTELTSPVLGDAAREANFTNEIGVDDTVRFLKNITGMWLFEECRREWSEADGRDVTVVELLDSARLAGESEARIDPDDARWAAPGFGVTALADSASEPTPRSRGEIVRCILQSIADRVAAELQVLQRLSDRSFTVLHVVGGGSRIDMMMQLLADATGIDVEAGPVEATALGNAGVQFIANGDVAGVAALRAWLGQVVPVTRYQPTARAGR